MQTNLSLVISIISLLFALLSPILSSWINGYYRIKEKKLELEASQAESARIFFFEHRAQVIENYLKAAGTAIKSNGNFEDFGKNMAEIYFYVDQELWPLIDSINSEIEAFNYDLASQHLISLSKALSYKNVRNQI